MADEKDKIRQIQIIIGTDADGIWGPKSQAALELLIRPKVWASSFADPADIAAWEKWTEIYIDRGYSRKDAQEKALGKGDNGVGYGGLNTASDQNKIAALPLKVIEAKWGTKENAHNKKIIVTYEGKDEIGVLGDYMSPGLKATIDLNPGFQKAFGLKPPFLVPVNWKWA